VQLAARDATHAAVVKRGTPDPFAATSSASDFPHAWRAFVNAGKKMHRRLQGACNLDWPVEIYSQMIN
jgi:hypothetical protein